MLIETISIKKNGPEKFNFKMDNTQEKRITDDHIKINRMIVINKITQQQNLIFFLAI